MIAVETIEQGPKNDEEVIHKSYPKAYASFLPVLERLSDPLQTILRGQLHSLESIFHSALRRNHNLIGDFEGVGGLTQRGEMSRILQSELLLRTEAPLEFVRRIAEGEALYMETEHSDPGEKMIYRLVISMGPEMLGHGRLIALAGLIFLARVAKAQKTELHWCVLPSKNSVNWFTEISVNSVKRFLKFAAYRDANTEDFETANEVWNAAFSEDRPGETLYQDWVIGSVRENANQSVFSKLPNALLVSISPPPREGPREAWVELRRNRVTARRVNLLFPEDVICVSALNRPFQPISKVAYINKTGGTAFPKLQGWESRYLLSLAPDRHIIRFENYRRGLLFLGLDASLGVTNSYYLALPEYIQLAGVMWSASGGKITILAQSQKDGSELLTYNSCDLFPKSNKGTTTTKYGQPVGKKVTSTHLFAKQQSHAVPILHPSGGANCYTSMGQPFDFRIDYSGEPTVNIKYKERRILFSEGQYKLLHNSNNTYFNGPSIDVVKGTSKNIASYPVENDLSFKDLHGVVFSNTSRGLAYSIHPGEWRILQNMNKRIPADYSQLDVKLAPYERVLRAVFNHKGAKLLIYSDVNFGGDGRLRFIYCDGNNITNHDTVFKFGKRATNLSALRIMDENSNVFGINLDEQGDPRALVALGKRSGQYSKTSINLDDILFFATEIDASRFFG